VIPVDVSESVNTLVIAVGIFIKPADSRNDLWSLFARGWSIPTLESEIHRIERDTRRLCEHDKVVVVS